MRQTVPSGFAPPFGLALPVVSVFAVSGHFRSQLRPVPKGTRRSYSDRLAPDATNRLFQMEVDSCDRICFYNKPRSRHVMIFLPIVLFHANQHMMVKNNGLECGEYSVDACVDSVHIS